MAAKISSKKKLLGSAVLGLGLLSLLLAYYFFTAPDGIKGAPVASPAGLPQGDSPSLPPRQESGGVEAIVPQVPQDKVVDSPNAQSRSLLSEGELERLQGVLRNSLYPSFQAGFQLDLESRAAIDAFVASMPEGLSSEDLESIFGMIESQLPTPEAEDVAFIITHLYRLEQEEARIMNEAGPVTTMADQLEAQERLSQLREEWFGPELSARLFSDADEAQASSDQDTAESRTEGSGTEELAESLTAEQAELADMESAWEQRYQRFLAEKRFIEMAGLDQSEKDKQIEALLRQHYAPGELDAARAFDQQRR